MHRPRGVGLSNSYFIWIRLSVVEVAKIRLKTKIICASPCLKILQIVVVCLLIIMLYDDCQNVFRYEISRTESPMNVRHFYSYFAFHF
jgi:hypothetical protein